MSSELLGSAENTLKGNLGGAWDILSGYADAYTDLGIGKQFGGAAAAYSLRDVGAMNGPVVRVRRDSDNSEQDFPASAVTQIPDWCNQSVIKPLDVRELNSGGSGDRDGNFVIAKAAYSLRSLGDRQATVAATGDTVTAANGKYVVQVRRSSDDTIKSFTADEVSNGTLESFVNEDVTIYQSDFSAGVNGFTQTSTTTLTGNQDGVSDEAGTTKDNVLKAVKASDAQGYIQRDQGVVAGLTYTVSGTFFAPTSNTSVDGIMIKDGLSGSALSDFPSGYLVSSGVWTDFSFSYTATASGNQRINFGISSLASNPTSSSTGSTGDIFYISDLKFVETTSNGFVRTWYDQSVTDQGGGTGTGNHATQATAANQPKIVSDGSLNTAGGLLFDGSNDELSVSGEPVITAASGGTYSAFSVQTVAADGSEAGYLYGNASASNGSSLYASATKFTLTNKSAATLDNIARSAGQNLLSAVYNNGDAGLLVNGSGTMTDAGTYDFSAGSSDFIIGNRNGGTVAATFLAGTINEIIIYNSNQTDNRGAFEANIAEHYSISGVPAEDNQVNGFVETWYDQSGNGNNATQTTATLQPKIVSAGSLNADGVDFDGTDDFLELNSVLGAGANQSIFVVQKSDDLESSSTATIFDNRDSSGQGSSVLIGSGDFKYFVQSASTTAGSSNLNENLLTSINNSSNTSAGLNGTLTAGTAGGTIANPNDEPRIGARSYSSAALFYDGSIKELITYNTDQSANRTNIESNIANHYGITLS